VEGSRVPLTEPLPELPEGYVLAVRCEVCGQPSLPSLVEPGPHGRLWCLLCREAHVGAARWIRARRAAGVERLFVDADGEISDGDAFPEGCPSDFTHTGGQVVHLDGPFALEAVARGLRLQLQREYDAHMAGTFACLVPRREAFA
jgi:hypothetical protein